MTKSEVKFVLTPLKPTSDPVIEGRIPTPWLIEHAHELTQAEFYDQSLTEDDLRRIIAERSP